MRGKQIHFFASKGDLENILKSIEASRSLKYVQSGLFNNRKPVIYESFLDYEDLGINKRGQVSNGDIMFLVMNKISEVFVEPVPQFSGKLKYAIDMRLNQASLLIVPSGFYDSNTLIAGKIGTISTHPVSVEIYDLFRKTILKNSKQIGYARVCPDALEFMKNGGRMVTMGIDSPFEYDLKIK